MLYTKCMWCGQTQIVDDMEDVPPCSCLYQKIERTNMTDMDLIQKTLNTVDQRSKENEGDIQLLNETVKELRAEIAKLRDRIACVNCSQRSTDPDYPYNFEPNDRPKG